MNIYDYYITPEEYEEAQKNGISYKTLNFRVRQMGWSKRRAITQPLQQRNITKWHKVAKENGIRTDTFWSRVNKYGWEPEKAATAPVKTTQEVMDNALTFRRIYSPEMYQLALQNGISEKQFRKRVKGYGWDPMRAATEPLWTSKEKGAASAKKVTEKYGDRNALAFQKSRV